jgi:signal peptide peptidase-like protein 2B
MALFVPHSDSYTFFWFTQNVMGSCMCIIFLSIIQINSIKVAAILLICAFFYDIFFVFVTPFLFQGKSIMLTVATSGGPPTADPLWCEKYPSDEGCKGGDPLPMLLAVPRLWDYAGGSSLLGLGDIVCK